MQGLMLGMPSCTGRPCGSAPPRLHSMRAPPPRNPPRPRAAASQGAAPASDIYTDLVTDKSFTCTECGKCCTGSGEIWMNEAEWTAAARHLGMESKHFLREFAKSYARRPGWRLVKRKHRSADCIFLRADNKCGIYGARPLQCSTYPWWPELMGDRAWAAEAEMVCEGIGHPEAPPLDVAGAAAQLKAQTEHEGKYDGATLINRTGGTWNL